MKRKEAEDIMGGKDAWANVDKTDGELAEFQLRRRVARTRRVWYLTCECRTLKQNEECDGYGWY